MGNQLVANTGDGASTVTPRPQQPQPLQLSQDSLRSYEDASQNDHDVRKFDMELHARTTQTINSMATGVNEPLSFSLDILREVTGCFLETDQQVLGIILESKKDIWKNPELFALVDDYFNTSQHTLEFCSIVEKFLTKAKHRQIILRAALRRLAEAVPGEDEYKKAIEDLGRFRSADTNMTSEMLEMFGTVYMEHLLMLQRLQSQRIQLDKKLKRVKSWKKTANIIFAATLVTVLVCSVVATALAAPPVVTAIVAALAAAGAFTPTGIWIKQLWKRFENVIQEQREVISSMQAGTYVAIKDLDNIRILVERLETEMESLIGRVDDDLVVEEHGYIRLAIQDIEEKLGVFTRNVDELGEYVDCCTRNIHQAKTVVLKRIMKPLDRGSEAGVRT